jgi:hypothetical protein
MSELIYPTLDLFVYNLREGLGDNQHELKKRRDNFLATLPQNIQGLLITAFEKELGGENTEYIELLEIVDKKAAISEFDTSLNNYFLKGYYYPVCLSDTYGLLFDCSVDEKDIPQNLSCLRYLKQQAKIIQNDLGKTWLISGILPNPNVDSENLAKNIYKTLMAEEKSKNLTDAAYEALIAKEWQYRKVGKFLNALVFEVWQIPPNWKSVEENSHILIFLYPDQKSMEDSAKFSKDWMRIFCYRNKVIWAYCEIQKIKQQLKDGFKTIRETINIVQNQSDLQQLKEILKNHVEIYSKYVINLNYVEIQSSTIEVNLHNYQEYLNYINNYLNTNAGTFGDTDLKFLEEFSNIFQKKYQAQVKKDYESLHPGTDILENQINTIRGIVEIEQAQRDRRLETQNTNFQNAVAVIGVAVATASFTASIVSPFVKDICELPSIKPLTAKQPLPEPMLNLALVLLLSLGLGWIAGWLTQKRLKQRQHSTH